MAYYLQHYFSPDFNHKRLTPVAMADGNTEAHYLGYVQNVVAGQLLAELVTLAVDPRNALPTEYDDLDELAEANTALDPNYIFDKPVFPMGPNCGRDPNNPNRIIALVNGYCFYHQGLITVKKLLNVRQNLNFATGSILFVNDVVVHGSVFPGFGLWGDNILIKERVDGAFIKAKGSITCLDAVKGAPTATLEACGTIHLTFCEAAQIKTDGNLIIDGSCMHSDLYVGGSLIVKGRLQGGNIHVGGVLYVKEQIGTERGAPTAINLGQSPAAVQRLRAIDQQVQIQAQKIKQFQGRSLLGPIYEQESAPYLELAIRKRDVAQTMKIAIQRRLRNDALHTDKCRVIVPGTVYPGVNISIGRASMKIVDPMKDVRFSLNEDDIIYNSPALPSKNNDQVPSV